MMISEIYSLTVLVADLSRKAAVTFGGAQEVWADVYHDNSGAVRCQSANGETTRTLVIWDDLATLRPILQTTLVKATSYDLVRLITLVRNHSTGLLSGYQVKVVIRGDGTGALMVVNLESHAETTILAWSNLSALLSILP